MVVYFQMQVLFPGCLKDINVVARKTYGCPLIAISECFQDFSNHVRFSIDKESLMFL